MIYIQTLNRRWDAGQKLLVNQPKHIKQEFQLYIANEYVRLIKLSINTQRYRSKWKDLTPGYSAYKARVGLSPNIWEATGQLKSSIKVTKKSNVITVGFDKRLIHKGSKSRIWKIAIWMEYGTIRMPPRPLFRQVYIYMSSNMDFFLNKFINERGGLF